MKLALAPLLVLIISTIAHAAPPTFAEKWKEAAVDKKKSGYKEYEASYLKAVGSELHGFAAGCL